MKNSERAVYFYDVEIASKADGIDLPDMPALIDAILHVFQNDNNPINVGNGKAKLKVRDYRINKSANFITFLVALSDTTAPNAVYSDLVHNTYDELEKTPGQGNEFGAHVSLSLTPNKSTGLYLTLLEGMSGLSHTIIRRAFNTYLNRYCKLDGYGFSSPLLSGARKRDGSRKTKNFIPRLDFHGHISDQFVYQVEMVLCRIYLYFDHQKNLILVEEHF